MLYVAGGMRKILSFRPKPVKLPPLFIVFKLIVLSIAEIYTAQLTLNINQSRNRINQSIDQVINQSINKFNQSTNNFK